MDSVIGDVAAVGVNHACHCVEALVLIMSLQVETLEQSFEKIKPQAAADRSGNGV